MDWADSPQKIDEFAGVCLAAASLLLTPSHEEAYHGLVLHDGAVTRLPVAEEVGGADAVRAARRGSAVGDAAVHAGGNAARLA